jgi:hypothetical protein
MEKLHSRAKKRNSFCLPIIGKLSSDGKKLTVPIWKQYADERVPVT